MRSTCFSFSLFDPSLCVFLPPSNVSLVRVSRPQYSSTLPRSRPSTGALSSSTSCRQTPTRTRGVRHSNCQRAGAAPKRMGCRSRAGRRREGLAKRRNSARKSRAEEEGRLRATAGIKVRPLSLTLTVRANATFSLAASLCAASGSRPSFTAHFPNRPLSPLLARPPMLNVQNTTAATLRPTAKDSNSLSTRPNPPLPPLLPPLYSTLPSPSQERHIPPSPTLPGALPRPAPSS